MKKKKKLNKRRRQVPDVQDGHGHQPNEPWSLKVNNGISEKLDTGRRPS